MGLRENILTQPVSELDLRQVILVPPTATVRQAVAKMREKKLGCAVVVDANNRILGRLTERRLISLLLNDPTALDETVDSHKDEQQECVKLTDPIASVIHRMESTKLRFVLVVDDQGRPVGLTGQKSIVEFIADHFPRQVKVQRMRAKLHMDQREGA